MSQRKRPGLKKRGAIWHIAIYHRGKAVRQSLETTDQTRAEQAYDKIRAELWDEKYLNKKPEVLWEEAALAYVNNFDRQVRDGERKAASLDASRLKWLNAELKGVPLSSISKKYVAKLLEGTNSQRHASALINAVLNVAVDEELIPACPSVLIGKINRRTRYLTTDEARLLLRQGGFLHDAILFSLATGLRQANVIRLRWAWIKDRAVIIPAEHFKQNREHVQPLNRTAMACIQRQLGKHKELVFTDEGQPFRSRRGNDGKAWDFRWHQAVQGIADFRWHDLRHTWASWSLQAGAPEAIVETLGGWQSSKMVRRYAHASVEFLRPYAELLDPVMQHIGSTEVPSIAAVK